MPPRRARSIRLETQPGGRWFGAWLVVGAAYAFGVLGALTIGPFLLLAAGIGGFIATRRAA